MREATDSHTIDPYAYLGDLGMSLKGPLHPNKRKEQQVTEQNQDAALPDRAEEKRVDTPQNQTQAPVENAQAEPTQSSQTAQDATPSPQETTPDAPESEQTESS